MNKTKLNKVIASILTTTSLSLLSRHEAGHALVWCANNHNAYWCYRICGGQPAFSPASENGEILDTPYTLPSIDPEGREWRMMFNLAGISAEIHSLGHQGLIDKIAECLVKDYDKWMQYTQDLEYEMIFAKYYLEFDKGETITEDKLVIVFRNVLLANEDLISRNKAGFDKLYKKAFDFFSQNKNSLAMYKDVA